MQFSLIFINDFDMHDVFYVINFKVLLNGCVHFEYDSDNDDDDDVDELKSIIALFK